MKTNRVSKIDEFMNKVYFAVSGDGEFMSDDIRRDIMEELALEEKALGLKYDIKDLRDSTFKLMKICIVIINIGH